ncbi:hypothetical protein [Leptospira kanakyensis]|uniref:Uncharacterized protein n=1 Tax=Leptospira kanakyensis TaxID=2484968 RepID=A0A6N4Q7I0_9LEPT|nr:hypothetical protein [Leptospira kanakyensis]MCW7470899.1 hypothetical protein [Leptospira kanakyensis]MCW7482910.1 hypothetical protein [Leptospira kanakyensis]TGK54419.1 hypothetical protein EHQ11_02370 [Leptospira kanakyensis]TGK59113.1 hypothetical protein EHQ16_12245 [Leptospira kanakyensis]TGK75263.1 hypothetical protein EHQ18_02920 [Leptospira kanakyensis]
MKHFLLIVLLILQGIPLFSDSKPKVICASLEDCEKKADSTEIHRKKITLLTFGITEYGKDVPIQNLLPVYLKRVKSTILEANGDTGYKGEVVLKVTHKPEYKQSQLLKAEEDIQFLDTNQSSLSKENYSELLKLKTLLEQSK